jgi:hypothetical protein
MIDVLQEPAAKRAAHVVQASLVEVQIPINVQSDLKQWKQEVEDQSLMRTPCLIRP